MISAPPKLCEAATVALDCWLWCRGWEPQRWPLYAALYPVPDWHLTIDLMLEIRRDG